MPALVVLPDAVSHSKQVTEIRPALQGCWIYANHLDLPIRGTQLNIHLGDRSAQMAFYHPPKNHRRPLSSSLTSYLRKAAFFEFIHVFVVFRRGSSLCCGFTRAFQAGCPTVRPQPREQQQRSGLQDPDRHFPNLKFFLKRSHFPSKRQASCKHASLLRASVSSRLNIKSRSRRQLSSAPETLFPPSLTRNLLKDQRFVWKPRVNIYILTLE